jgi:hypothetical protein
MTSRRQPQPLHDQRELGEIVNDTFSFHFRQIWLFAAIVAPSVLVGVVVALLSYLITDNPNTQFLIEFVFLPIDVLVYQLVAAGVVAVMKANDEGRIISAGDALDIAQDRAADILKVAAKLMLAAILAGTIIGTYWGVKWLIQWAVAIPALIFGGLSASEALEESSRLIKGRWWATLGRLFVAGLILGIPSFLVGTAIAATIGAPIGTILSSLPNLISTPYPIIATVLIYFDRKARTAAA